MTDLTQIIDQITRHFGGEHLPAVFMKLSANEPLFASLWSQYEAVMAEGEIDVPTKELLGLCVGVAKPNEYIIGLQQRRIRRAGVDEEVEMEALSVAGFFEGVDSFAHALHVDSDVQPRNMTADDIALIDQEIDVNVPYVIQSTHPVVSQVYEELKVTMGISFVPNIFKAMAHQPMMLKAKWESYKVIMLHGQLPRQTKELIAIVVSAVNGCFYSVDAHSATGRQLGLSTQGLVELACVIDLFTNLCTLAKGFRLGKRNF